MNDTQDAGLRLAVYARVSTEEQRDPPSPERPCASLSLHLHQVVKGVKGTFTLELSNMLGTPEKAGIPPAGMPANRCSILRARPRTGSGVRRCARVGRRCHCLRAWREARAKNYH